MALTLTTIAHCEAVERGIHAINITMQRSQWAARGVMPNAIALTAPNDLYYMDMKQTVLML
jgi:hypothetical protein